MQILRSTFSTSADYYNPKCQRKEKNKQGLLGTKGVRPSHKWNLLPLVSLCLNRYGLCACLSWFHWRRQRKSLHFMKWCLCMWNRKGGDMVTVQVSAQKSIPVGTKREQLDVGPSLECRLPKQRGGAAEKRALQKHGWDGFTISNIAIKVTHYYKRCVWTKDFLLNVLPLFLECLTKSWGLCNLYYCSSSFIAAIYTCDSEDKHSLKIST